MLDIIVRIIALWFQDSTHGINVLAAKLPRHNLSGPDDPAPPTVAIVNDADDRKAAENVMNVEVVEATPTIVVWGSSHIIRPVKGYMVGMDAVLGVGFITDDQQDVIAMNRACGYLMRAATISLARFNVQSISKASRSLNGIEIDRIAQIEEQRITAVQGNRKLWGFLLPHVSAVDSYTSTMLGSPQL